jgi:hypothetical protein
MIGKARRVVQTLSFEFSDDVCNSASIARQRDARGAPEFPALNHQHYLRMTTSKMARETQQAMITLRAWWNMGVLGFD